MNIGKYSYDEFIELSKSFHGYTAPGLIMGGYLVAAAMERISEDILFDCLCETGFCLPDAVQLLTPCTIGNGWLKIVDLGRFALTLYDKYSGEGIRAYPDLKRLPAYPEIGNWFLKKKKKKDQDTNRLLSEIRAAGTRLFGFETVRVHEKYLKKREKGAIGICPSCKEAYPVQHGEICLACNHRSPYLNSMSSGLEGDFSDTLNSFGETAKQDISYYK